MPGIDAKPGGLGRLQFEQLPGEAIEQRGGSRCGRHGTLGCNRKCGAGGKTGKGRATGRCENVHSAMVSAQRGDVKRWLPVTPILTRACDRRRPDATLQRP
ncbi:hypothetical protein GCM10011395_05890 [Sphingomonas psychrolutea]|uniref:Uncharacterized protein n=1 Tax=Sphingomonas psychrolutea TaxID=1259676 RepID=A0ABQ1G7Q7_9SPHN|nr:hypothetical protein GCM10011395_05890 [Sphingomonas psychrolutea]